MAKSLDARKDLFDLSDISEDKLLGETEEPDRAMSLKIINDVIADIFEKVFTFCKFCTAS